MKKLNLLLSLGVTFLLTVTSAQPQTSGPADAAPLLVQMVRLPGDNAPSRIVRVPANRALARVNGEAITLSDLLPVSDPPTSAEYILSPERYASRLDRAIERVLTRQAAQAEGIVLSADQQRQRDRVRERLLASEGAAGDVIHLNRIGTLGARSPFSSARPPANCCSIRYWRKPARLRRMSPKTRSTNTMKRIVPTSQPCLLRRASVQKPGSRSTWPSAKSWCWQIPPSIKRNVGSSLIASGPKQPSLQ